MVEEICKLATLGTATDRIELELNLAAALPPVLIDHVQIQQVVLNLVRNSIDALNDCETRTITVATVSSGDLVEVVVSDNGPGVPSAGRSRRPSRSNIRNGSLPSFSSTPPVSTARTRSPYGASAPARSWSWGSSLCTPR